MSWLSKYRGMAFIASGFFVMVGTYNAVVINSESSLYGSDVKFVKRLDEMYGVTVPGRDAASVNWQKIGSAPSPRVIAIAPNKFIAQSVSTVDSASSYSDEPAPPTAAVQEELSLNLVEVLNPKKWANGLPNNQFSGSLTTNNGVIESLSVSLPNGEGVSVSFSEMTGNVFEYDLGGELYSGMMYQVDQNSYMVTLSNGPLEGTRLRFLAESGEEQEQPQQNIAENVGGNNSEEYDRQVQAEEAVAQNQMNYQEMLNADQQMQQQAEQPQQDVQVMNENQETGYEQQVQEQAFDTQSANLEQNQTT